MASRSGQDPLLGRTLGRVALQSAAHPWRVVILLVLLTAGAGLGMTQLETSADMLKILPEGHPTTEAAQNASQEFRGFYDTVSIFYEIDEGKCQILSDSQLPLRVSESRCGNVTDEVYVRAMNELTELMFERLDAMEYAIDTASFIKIVNYTNSGFANPDPGALLDALLTQDPAQATRPQVEAYSMPDTSLPGEIMYESAWQGALAADESVTDLVATTFLAGRTLVFFDTVTEPISRIEVGNQVYDFIDWYQSQIDACDAGDASCLLQWNAFTSEGLAVRGVSANDAHASEVTQRDISRLAPFIIMSILLVLYLAFRDVRVILVAAANLLVSFVWTAGLMGYLSIPFSALNMTVIPLILGVGIDYGIHIISEFLEHKADGMSNRESFQEAGSRAGIAMFLATLTTIAGLMLMALSPSVLMAQLGIVSSLALLVTFVFTLTLVPALLTLTRKEAAGRKQEGSKLTLGAARLVAKAKVPVVLLLLVVTAGAAYSMQSLEPEGFGNPELNYPEGDRLRDDMEFVLDVFYGGSADAQSNFLVLEGDMTLPEVHHFMDVLAVKMQEHPDVNAFATASMTRIIRAYLALDQGTPDAVVNIALDNVPDEDFQASRYPQTKEEIRQTLDDLMETPMANFMTIMVSPDYQMATVTYDTHQDLDFESVERIWKGTLEAVQQAREETGVTGAMVNVQPFGNNAFSYLFIKEEQPWVNAVGIMAFVLVVGMIALLTRSWRATACAFSTMAVTSVWWLGLLPLMGIGLNVGLMLPMVFIMAIGTDDAIHLIWNMQRSGDREKVWRFVGKAVFLTSATTFVAFMIFSDQTDRLVNQTLLATSTAIIVMYLATMLVVPLFYPPTPAAVLVTDAPAKAEARPLVQVRA